MAQGKEETEGHSQEGYIEMTKDLAPCPFCQGVAVSWEHKMDIVISCGQAQHMGSETCAGKTIKASKEAWNHRTPTPDVKGLVEALRFYAAGRHVSKDKWFEGEAGYQDICTEDGTIAREALKSLGGE